MNKNIQNNLWRIFYFLIDIIIYKQKKMSYWEDPSESWNGIKNLSYHSTQWIYVIEISYHSYFKIFQVRITNCTYIARMSTKESSPIELYRE